MMKLSLRLVFGKPELTCVCPDGLLPLFTGNRPGNGPLPVNEPLPIRLALSGLSGMPLLCRRASASGMLLAQLLRPGVFGLGSAQVEKPPNETVAGLLTRLELLTSARSPSYAPK